MADYNWMFNRDLCNQAFDGDTEGYLIQAIDRVRHEVTHVENPMSLKKYIVIDFGVPVSASAINAQAGADDQLKCRLKEHKNACVDIRDMGLNDPVTHSALFELARLDIKPVREGDVVKPKPPPTFVPSGLRLLNAVKSMKIDSNKDGN